MTYHKALKNIISLFLILHYYSPPILNAATSPPFQIEIGETEVVDRSVSRTSCPGYYDNTIRAFINNTGTLIYTGTDDQNRYALGDNLSDFRPQCGSLIKSDYDSDPNKFNDAEYLMSTYSLDGSTVYGILHTEYHGWTHNNCGCTTSDFSCLVNCYEYSLNLTKSVDGGKTFSHATPPTHNIVHTAVPYSPSTTPSGKNYGFSSVSNIIGGDGYYYALLTAYTRSSPSDYGICVMRTSDLGSPTSWRFWDGTSYSLAGNSQGGSLQRCANVGGSGTAITSSMTMIYNDYLKKYLSIGNDWGGHTTPPNLESRFAMSDSLTSWTGPYLLARSDQTGYFAYGTLLQPGDPSRNFELTGRSPWFYYVTCDSGVRQNYCMNDPNKTKLMRTRVRFSKPGDENKFELIALHFNEHRGTKTLDSSFYGNDGDLSGGTVFKPGTTSNYMYFSLGSSLAIPHHPSLDLTNSFTISLKLRTSLAPNSGTFPTILSKANATTRNYGLYLTPSGNIMFNYSKNGAFISTISNKVVNDGTWHDIAITYDKDKGSINIYLDEQISSVTGSIPHAITEVNHGDLVLGGEEWVGDLEDFTIYNYIVPPAVQDMPGDLNGDGKVNIYDFVKLLNGFNTVYTPDDFTDLLTNYGK